LAEPEGIEPSSRDLEFLLCPTLDSIYLLYLADSKALYSSARSNRIRPKWRKKDESNAHVLPCLRVQTELPPLAVSSMLAESKGFEPLEGFYTLNSLANCHLRPLGQLSMLMYYNLILISYLIFQGKYHFLSSSVQRI
jgi:hypothetical protein